VIDEKKGTLCQVSYSISKRPKLLDTICDLRCREGTTIENIGYYSVHDGKFRCRNREALSAIAIWSKEKNLTDVVWTDLESKFDKKKGEPFVKTAVDYIQGLDAAGKSKAAEYVWRAPDFVNTPLRRALQKKPWFLHLPKTNTE
jgi:hypothetical protein